MKKRLLILFPVIILFFGACKKDEGPYAGLVPVNGGSINTGGNNGGGSTSANTYLPTTTGSSWTYVSDLPGNTEPAEAHITGVITKINGLDYFELKSSTPGKENSLQYYYVKDHSFKILATTEHTATTVEMYCLKDDLPVGGEWTGSPSASGSINGVPARTLGKIIEIGIDKTVLGNNYKNVIHTQVIIQYDYGSGFENSGTYDFYLAKGIGLIETDSNILGFVSSSKLSSYTIK